MKIDLKTVSTTLGIVGMIVAATLYLPTIAQDKVEAQATRQKETDATQDTDIKDLREQVVKLIVAQATTGTEIKHLTKALRASTKTDDDLKLEIKQLIKAIE